MVFSRGFVLFQFFLKAHPVVSPEYLVTLVIMLVLIKTVGIMLVELSFRVHFLLFCLDSPLCIANCFSSEVQRLLLTLLKSRFAVRSKNGLVIKQLLCSYKLVRACSDCIAFFLSFSSSRTNSSLF